MKIIFMGTPDFAIPTLKMLIKEHEVLCVVTKPDMPQRRGHKVLPPPVKQIAQQEGIDILQPDNVKTEEFCGKIMSYAPDLFVTVAYGKLLPHALLQIPPRGCVNVHASILPKYRGAAPIWHAVINGERETGITTMMTDDGMDTGDILLIDKIQIGPDDTMGEVHDALAAQGAITLGKTLEMMEAGTLLRTRQDEAMATYAPRLTRDVGRIHWDKSAAEIHNLVRGTDPTPGSYATYGGEIIKIRKTCVLGAESCEAPGTVMASGAFGIDVATGSGIVRIIELQGASGKRMRAADYINGHAIETGTVFE